MKRGVFAYHPACEAHNIDCNSVAALQLYTVWSTGKQPAPHLNKKCRAVRQQLGPNVKQHLTMCTMNAQSAYEVAKLYV